ncbi:hypothetical protein [Argonema galeatum]
MEGPVTEALPTAVFLVDLDNGVEFLAQMSGKIRRN